MQERQQLLASWRKSGLSADAFSRQMGLGKSSLWRWSRAVRSDGLVSGRDTERGVQNGAASPFVEVQVGRGAGAEQPNASIRATSGQAPAIEIECPQGFRVRVYPGADSETLRQLLDLLPRAARC
jgi:transposase-like protein